MESIRRSILVGSSRVEWIRVESCQVKSWSGVESTVDSSQVDSNRVVEWSGVE